MEDTFASPIKKLANFFHDSRDKWKAKAKESKKEIKGYKKRIIFLETSKAKLKEKNRALKAKNQELEANLIKKNNISSYPTSI